MCPLCHADADEKGERAGAYSKEELRALKNSNRSSEDVSGHFPTWQDKKSLLVCMGGVYADTSSPLLSINETPQILVGKNGGWVANQANDEAVKADVPIAKEDTEMRARKTWVYSPPKPPKPKIPDAVKQHVQAEADRLIETFKPQYIESPEPEPQFNYITDLYTKWHQSCLYLCATYTCPGPNALSPTFETPFTRLEYAGGSRFHLAYMRHTGKWWEVYRDLTVDEAIATIRDEGAISPRIEKAS